MKKINEVNNNSSMQFISFISNPFYFVNINFVSFLLFNRFNIIFQKIFTLKKYLNNYNKNNLKEMNYNILYTLKNIFQ